MLPARGQLRQRRVRAASVASDADALAEITTAGEVSLRW
jgi:hypothetical protein